MHGTTASLWSCVRLGTAVISIEWSLLCSWERAMDQCCSGERIHSAYSDGQLCHRLCVVAWVLLQWQAVLGAIVALVVQLRAGCVWTAALWLGGCAAALQTSLTLVAVWHLARQVVQPFSHQLYGIWPATATARLLQANRACSSVTGYALFCCAVSPSVRGICCRLACGAPLCACLLLVAVLQYGGVFGSSVAGLHAGVSVRLHADACCVVAGLVQWISLQLCGSCG